VLHVESIIVIKTFGNLQDFLRQKTDKIFLSNKCKDKHWTIFCESCKPLFQSNTLHATFGRGFFKLRVTHATATTLWRVVQRTYDGDRAISNFTAEHSFMFLLVQKA